MHDTEYVITGTNLLLAVLSKQVITTHHYISHGASYTQTIISPKVQPTPCPLTPMSLTLLLAAAIMLYARHNVDKQPSILVLNVMLSLDIHGRNAYTICVHNEGTNQKQSTMVCDRHCLHMMATDLRLSLHTGQDSHGDVY